MRISDWCSDVCSSDLEAMIGTDRYRGSRPYMERALRAAVAPKGRSYNGRATTGDKRRGRLGATCAGALAECAGAVRLVASRPPRPLVDTRRAHFTAADH